MTQLFFSLLYLSDMLKAFHDLMEQCLVLGHIDLPANPHKRIDHLSVLDQEIGDVLFDTLHTVRKLIAFCPDFPGCMESNFRSW